VKSVKMKLPLRHEDTKFHKELNFNNLFLLHLCAFVPRGTKTLSSFNESNILIELPDYPSRHSDDI